MILISLAIRVMAAIFVLFGASTAAVGQLGTAVLTHHNDYRRSGWNSTETVLAPSTFTSGSTGFGVIATVNNLDDQIYAEPLVVPSLPITCPVDQTMVTCKPGLSAVHDVVFVATWNNSIYAIDADTGEILLKRNFGKAGNCGGINSTPVIDPVKGILYVMAHVVVNDVQTYNLYAISIGSFMNVLPPYVITATNTWHTLTDGTTYPFDTARSCQRSALLLLNGNIYAGFRGNEYLAGNPPAPASGPTRGWLLGWNASDLSPLPPLLTNQQAAAPNSFFLSSIWMSGSGIASDGTNLYFSTGNSDPSGMTYDPVKNIEESVVKVSPNMTVSSIFTPSNFAGLDLDDFEIGSGGVMVLPGSLNLVVEVGKDGRMFILNSESLGGYTPGGPDNVIDMHNVGGCWCAPSYFIGSDGIMRVVSSGGNSVITWKVTQNGPSPPTLVQDGVGQIPPGVIQDPGFFTSVSSNNIDSAVIWAVGRPTDSFNAITLYAFDAASVNGTLPLLGKYPAGTWSDTRNTVSVPVVANGKVYVVSGNAGAGIGAVTGPSGTLTIFGVLP